MALTKQFWTVDPKTGKETKHQANKDTFKANKAKGHPAYILWSNGSFKCIANHENLPEGFEWQTSRVAA